MVVFIPYKPTNTRHQCTFPPENCRYTSGSYYQLARLSCCSDISSVSWKQRCFLTLASSSSSSPLSWHRSSLQLQSTRQSQMVCVWIPALLLSSYRILVSPLNFLRLILHIRKMSITKQFLTLQLLEGFNEIIQGKYRALFLTLLSPQ